MVKFPDRFMIKFAVPRHVLQISTREISSVIPGAIRLSNSNGNPRGICDRIYEIRDGISVGIFK